VLSMTSFGKLFLWLPKMVRVTLLCEMTGSFSLSWFLLTLDFLGGWKKELLLFMSQYFGEVARINVLVRKYW
jgi:hypothetical protein